MIQHYEKAVRTESRASRFSGLVVFRFRVGREELIVGDVSARVYVLIEAPDLREPAQ